MMIDPVEIERIIGRRFVVYDIKQLQDHIRFYVMPKNELHSDFDAVRRILVPMGIVPVLSSEMGHDIISIYAKEPHHPHSVVLNIVMFIATLISTMAAGAMIWYDYVSTPIMEYSAEGDMLMKIWGSPENWINGTIYFALPLILILGIHEMGHYLMSKKYGVDASLPFFLPAPPPFFLLGTFGAFISMRDPMPNRRAMVDIGAAGPIAGFLVALPVTLLGFHLTNTMAIPATKSFGEVLVINTPMMFDILGHIIPLNPSYAIHPTAFAGWVGFFVTFINLLPAGQLDGGHISRAIFGENARYVSYGVVLFLFVVGIGLNAPTWIMFGLLVMFLGLRHPPSLDELMPLGVKQKATALFALFMFVTCFVPQPFVVTYIEPEVHSITLHGQGTYYFMPGEHGNITFVVENNGNMDENITIIFRVQDFNTSELRNITPERLGINTTWPSVPWHKLYNDGSVNMTFWINVKKGTSMSVKIPIVAPPRVGEVVVFNITAVNDNINESLTGGIIASFVSHPDVRIINDNMGILEMTLLHGNISISTPDNITVSTLSDPVDVFMSRGIWYTFSNTSGNTTLYIIYNMPQSLRPDIYIFIRGVEMDNLYNITSSTVHIIPWRE